MIKTSMNNARSQLKCVQYACRTRMRKMRNIPVCPRTVYLAPGSWSRASVIRTMKMPLFLVACLLSAAAVQSFAAQDAAMEAQEGDIEHWIEYYKKERGRSNETVTEEMAPPQTDTRDAGNKERDTPSTQSTTPQSGD